MAKRTTDVISIRELRSAVEKAIKLVEKDNVRGAGTFVINPGIIVGRIVQEAVALETAEAAAKTITSKVSADAKRAGISALTPAVLKLPGHIIVGFVDQQASRLFVE
jgi:hypothetical protein